MPTYAVTGASGRLGRLAVHELLAQGVPASNVVAVVRSRGKAADLADRGVQMREADYSRPQTLGAALVGVDRLLLISSSEAGHRVPTTPTSSRPPRPRGSLASPTPACSTLMTRPTRWPARTTTASGRCTRPACGSPCCATAGTPRTTPTSWTNTSSAARFSSRPAAAESQRPPAKTRLRPSGRDRTAPGRWNRTYELGGPDFDLSKLAQVITRVTGTPVIYTDLSVDDYGSRVKQAGLDEANARFVAALDASIAHGDLETHSEDLARLLGHPPTPLTDVLRAARGGEVTGSV